MKDFEKNLGILDEIIEQIEDGETLENSLELYKNGLDLIAKAVNELNDFQAQINVLRVENGVAEIETYTEGI